MLKLTNSQCDNLLSRQASELFSNPDRRFPVDDAFKILDIITIIRQRIKTYHDSYRKIVIDNGGMINDDGTIIYASKEKRLKAIALLDQISSIEVEIPCSKIKIKDDWPQLSIAEAQILKPLIEENGDA